LPRLHFADDDEEQWFADISEEGMQRIERRRIAPHFRSEAKQLAERSFELSPKLQIIIGDHAGRLTSRRGRRGGWRRAWRWTRDGNCARRGRGWCCAGRDRRRHAEQFGDCY